MERSGPQSCAPLALLVRLAALLAAWPLASSAAADTAEVFETVPERSAVELLPATMIAASDFHVVDPVQGDGLMNRFVLESRFGRFDAYGRLALAMRVREVAALTELAKMSSIRIVAGGMEHGVESEVRIAAGVIRHPVAIVTGIPTGIAHLFHGYTARAQEMAADARSSVQPSAKAGDTAHVEVKKGADAAKRYAEHYVGITSAERGWYKRLGVDPYTNNAVLRDAVRKAAKIEAAGSFGVKFVGLPAIPGIAITQRVVDAIYNEDPAAIRARTRKTLAGYGLSPMQIESWLNAPVLSPTRQALLVSAAEELKGVTGRAELFRHSLDLTSDAEAQVYLRSVGLLVLAHGQHPLAEVVAGVRLPTATRADGRLVVCGAFEAVYWTEDVAKAEEQLRASLPLRAKLPGRELWLAGTLSERAHRVLLERGWELHEVSDAPGS
ncbi:MAG TPA: hypothetical protein VLX90_00425 [Steroidobacteraceae bacterium]|nr:hypothetical protein [Steroidobacteraceae bacterium]